MVKRAPTGFFPPLPLKPSSYSPLRFSSLSSSFSSLPFASSFPFAPPPHSLSLIPFSVRSIAPLCFCLFLCLRLPQTSPSLGRFLRSSCFSTLVRSWRLHPLVCLSPLSETDADKKDALPFGSNWSTICRDDQPANQPHYAARKRRENEVETSCGTPPGSFNCELKGRSVRPKRATPRS